MKIKWHNNSEDTKLQQRGAKNILKHTPRPHGPAKRVQTPLESFSLFFSKEMINNTVKYTNQNIKPAMERFADVFDESDKYTHFRLVDSNGILAYIGLLYLRRALNVNLRNTRDLWFHESSNDLFAATILWNRFHFISKFVTFDNKDTRDDRWKYDKYACIRELFEMMNERNAKCRYPSAFLAVDETLHPYRGNIGFKQYNSNKPAKYGLLYRSLCDASVWYSYYSLPYAGKPEDLSGDASKYYISGTDEYTKYLVNEVSRHNSIQGCNISMDRYFTSVTLAEWALDRNFTIVGTMRHDRKGIPKELEVMKNRDERSVLYVHHGEKNIMLVSYVDKKKSGKKNIIRLTTLHDTVKVSNDKRSKPQVLDMYDHTKGGADFVDLLSTHHTTRIKSKRWPLNALAFILGTVRTNSKTILSDNKAKLSNFDFTYALGKALVLPSIQNRYQNNNGIQLPILQKIRRVLGIKETNRRPQIETPATLFGRCHICVQEIVGTSQCKKMQQKMNNKVKSKCARCSSFICKNILQKLNSFAVIVLMNKLI